MMVWGHDVSAAEVGDEFALPEDAELGRHLYARVPASADGSRTRILTLVVVWANADRRPVLVVADAVTLEVA